MSKRRTLAIAKALPMLVVLLWFGACSDDTTDDDGSSGGSVGSTCSATDPCGDGAWCDFQPSFCGANDREGTCEPSPTECTEEYTPTCGCDGMIHSNPCFANVEGVDVDYTGACAPPTATSFACGGGFCELATDYCEIIGTDIGGEDSGYSCKPIPATCGATPSCACLDMEMCTDRCEGDAASGMTTTCFGG